MLGKRIKTKFKQNEDFTYIDVPKHFYSVTDESIHAIRSYCIRSISKKYSKDNYPPAALRDMIHSISGEFNGLYNQLEGDYNTRKSNLEMAYNNGLASIDQEISEFDIILNEYKVALKNYNTASEHAIGEKVDDSLTFDEEKISAIKSDVARMRKEQINA